MKKETKEQQHELLTLREVSQFLRLSESAIRMMEKSGELPSYRVGKKLMVFKKDEVLNLLKAKNH
jgi:excisionase family DNA binding protein